MVKRSRLLAFAAALVLSIGAALFAASPAYAGCQANAFQLNLSNGSVYTYYCSGYQYPYSYVNSVSTGPWGGWVTYQHNGNLYSVLYCDNQWFGVGGEFVTEVYMASTRPNWC